MTLLAPRLLAELGTALPPRAHSAHTWRKLREGNIDRACPSRTNKYRQVQSTQAPPCRYPRVLIILMMDQHILTSYLDIATSINMPYKRCRDVTTGSSRPRNSRSSMAFNLSFGAHILVAYQTPHCNLKPSCQEVFLDCTPTLFTPGTTGIVLGLVYFKGTTANGSLPSILSHQNPKRLFIFVLFLSHKVLWLQQAHDEAQLK